MTSPEEWTAIELFEYLQDRMLIDDEEVFDDWMHNRTDMIKMVKEDIEDEEE
jgi:hypothetical protein